MYLKLVAVGNLGNDPEMRYTPNGQAVTSFPLATSRKWKNAEGDPQEETTWLRVSVWGNQAETCNQYLTKGKRVLIEGSLIPDKETGGPRVYQRKDGSSGASFEVRADVVRFLSPKGEGGEAASEPAGESELAF